MSSPSYVFRTSEPVWDIVRRVLVPLNGTALEQSFWDVQEMTAHAYLNEFEDVARADSEGHHSSYGCGDLPPHTDGAYLQGSPPRVKVRR